MDLSLFALNASREFGQRVADALGAPLARHEEREFEDGEHKARPLENVRGRDVYVVHSLYGDGQQSVNDKLVRLLLFLGALRDASAGRITAVIPYLCYARKDRRSKPRDPVSTRHVAGLLESVGADCVVTLDVHNLASYENAFRIRTEHLEARKLFAEFFRSLAGDEPVAVVSPDVGGVKRAEAFRESLERRLGRAASRAFMEKSRSEGVVSGKAFVATLPGARPSSSTTSSAAARRSGVRSRRAAQRARDGYWQPHRTASSLRKRSTCCRIPPSNSSS